MPIRLDNVTNATIYTTDGTTATRWGDDIANTEWTTWRPYTELNFTATTEGFATGGTNVDIYDVASRIAKYLVKEIEEKIGIEFDEEKLEEFLSSSFKED